MKNDIQQKVDVARSIHILEFPDADFIAIWDEEERRVRISQFIEVSSPTQLIDWIKVYDLKNIWIELVEINSKTILTIHCYSCYFTKQSYRNYLVSGTIPQN